ncbi:hypothetical protein SKAU_G00230550 [Synaphobranchus kaupii]|uniref:Uncharacterized protein n=1 Tax=Synaphobranchus kaupii TaxID=118154 RepID=A0A9Q1IT80_SYNKA|nr:hypothetical protein SKAU_G00230550 [Synaphobranchus kaupii]
MRRSLEVGEGRETGPRQLGRTCHLAPAPTPPAPPCWEGSQCCACAEGVPMIQLGISALRRPHADPLCRSLFERGGVNGLGGCFYTVEGEWPGSSLEIQTGRSLKQHSGDGIHGTLRNTRRRCMFTLKAGDLKLVLTHDIGEYWEHSWDMEPQHSSTGWVTTGSWLAYILSNDLG